MWHSSLELGFLSLSVPWDVLRQIWAVCLLTSSITGISMGQIQSQEQKLCPLYVFPWKQTNNKNMNVDESLSCKVFNKFPYYIFDMVLQWEYWSCVGNWAKFTFKKWQRGSWRVKGKHVLCGQLCSLGGRKTDFKMWLQWSWALYLFYLKRVAVRDWDAEKSWAWVQDPLPSHRGTTLLLLIPVVFYN